MNLRGAARAWANGGTEQRSDADETAAFFGLIRKEKEQRPAVYAVWPENWEAVELFLAMQSQWRHAGMSGVRVGLEYSALPAVFDLLQITDRRDAFARLQVMEYAALEALAEDSKPEG
jgi:hypothetical protein